MFSVFCLGLEFDNLNIYVVIQNARYTIVLEYLGYNLQYTISPVGLDFSRLVRVRNSTIG